MIAKKENIFDYEQVVTK